MCIFFHVMSSLGFYVAQPLHWVYSHDKMKEVLSGGLDPAFSPVSHNPFYCLKTGNQSPYGDQLIVQLKCLAEYKGTYVYAIYNVHV